MDDGLKGLLQQALEPWRIQQQLRAELVLPGDSYWYYRPQRDFPPKATPDPDDYDGGPRLSLGITQTGLSAAEQRKRVKRWCQRLPTLGTVKVLWFHGKVSQEMFEAACAMPGLEGLYVKWSGITTLAPLAGHASLSHLHIGGAPSATGLEALGSLPALVDLELHNVRAAADPGFLAGLPTLRSLELAGDLNSSKWLTLESLAPLAALVGLEQLRLLAIRVADGRLSPLAALPRLQWLTLCNGFRMEEIAWLAGRRPDVQCEAFAPTRGPVASLACKRCGQHTQHALTGKGKPWLCARCDAGKLARHIAEFEAIRSSARESPPC
jgi:hypothetical protein